MPITTYFTTGDQSYAATLVSIMGMLNSTELRYSEHDTTSEAQRFSYHDYPNRKLLVPSANYKVIAYHFAQSSYAHDPRYQLSL